MTKKRKILALLGTLSLLCCQGVRAKDSTLREGDLIFHSSRSSQSLAIQLATGSRYSHMGMIQKDGDRYFVYEAVQPVKKTPLKDWIVRGEGGHYVVKRLKDADRLLTPEALKKMRKTADGYRGKDYDLYFEWSDRKIYCSELVWKIYKQALGVEIGPLQKLKEFDLSNPVVSRKIKERFKGELPLEEPVISPGAMFESDLLETVAKK